MSRLLTSTELCKTAMKASAQRNKKISQQRVLRRWFVWCIWGILLPILGLLTLLFVALWHWGVLSKIIPFVKFTPPNSTGTTFALETKEPTKLVMAPENKHTNVNLQILENMPSLRLDERISNVNISTQTNKSIPPNHVTNANTVTTFKEN